ncbi:hypothetical protein ACFX11_033312 [Malus domestica]
MKIHGTLRYSDRLALEVSTASLRTKPHALAQTFLLPKGDEDLRKKIPMVHDSTQDSLVLHLLEEVNKLKAERQAEIPNWNQPRPGPLTRRIFDTPFK